MNQNEYLNMMMSRFDEAAKLHDTLKIIEIRFHGNPALPVLAQLIRNERDSALELGIQQYGLFKEQERSTESRAISGASS